MAVFHRIPNEPKPRLITLGGREIETIGLPSLTESYFVNQVLLRIKQLPRLTSAED